MGAFAEHLTRAYIDIVFQWPSRSQIIFASARWRKWLDGFNSNNKKFMWYSAVSLHCVGLETLLLKVRCRLRRTWELSIFVLREIKRRWIHSHQEGLENFLILAPLEENVKGHDLKQTPFCEIEKRISFLFWTISSLIKVPEASENKKQNFCPQFGKESCLTVSVGKERAFFLS